MIRMLALIITHEEKLASRTIQNEESEEGLRNHGSFWVRARRMGEDVT